MNPVVFAAATLAPSSLRRTNQVSRVNRQGSHRANHSTQHPPHLSPQSLASGSPSTSLPTSQAASQATSPSRQTGQNRWPWLGLCAFLLGWSAGIAPAQADSFTAPDRGYPDDGMTQGGGTRSPRTVCVEPDELALTPLVPHSSMALTQAAYPRFFWYTPKTQARWAEFRLFSVVEEGNQLWDDTLIYQTEFKIAGDAGIASLQLPASLNLPPLEVGQPYRWSVSLLCDPNDPIHNITAQSWIERTALASEQSQTLGTLDLGDRAALFAREGLWFDTLETVARLQCDPALGSSTAVSPSSWQDLLADEDIALENFSQVPFLGTCPPTLSVIATPLTGQ